jgi:D-cysteine desulfhydrase
MSPLIFQSAPHLPATGVGHVPLLGGPTPVHPLAGALELLGHARVHVKREDETDSLYGGNKVRNLEFLFGTAVRDGARRVATVAPLGSNFAAAMAAQAKRIGMPSDVFHFVPNRSDQIERHAAYTQRLGARLHTLGGNQYSGFAKAQLSSLAERLLHPEVRFLPSGGSAPVGVLGHVNAALELSVQIRRGEVPEPDVLVVGVGTCGTMAGLLAGVRLAGLRTHVIGVRCVDPLVCNPLRVRHLANGTLRLLRSRRRIGLRDVDLRSPFADVPYGAPLPQAAELIAEARRLGGLGLDTTYTTKVFAFLRSLAVKGELRGKEVLYWHTFSPAAMQTTPARALLLEGPYLDATRAVPC